MSHRPKCLELRKLPKPPTSLKSVNFRHTTPGSGVVLVTKHAPQPTSELIDPAYPGAHLPLARRHSLAPRWQSPHLTLYAFPKAFLSKPETPYDKPYKLRPYPAPSRRPDQRNADMSIQVLASNSRIIVRPTLRVKIKRRLREAIKLIVTRGAAVEKSRKGLKLVFRPEDVGADKWIAPDWTYIALPTTEMFRMPFAELLGMMRQALAHLHQRIPEVESGLRRSMRQEGGARSLLHPSTKGSTSRTQSHGKTNTPRTSTLRTLPPLPQFVKKF